MANSTDMDASPVADHSNNDDNIDSVARGALFRSSDSLDLDFIIDEEIDGLFSSLLNGDGASPKTPDIPIPISNKLDTFPQQTQDHLQISPVVSDIVGEAVAPPESQIGSSPVVEVEGSMLSSDLVVRTISLDQEKDVIEGIGAKVEEIGMQLDEPIVDTQTWDELNTVLIPSGVEAIEGACWKLSKSASFDHQGTGELVESPESVPLESPAIAEDGAYLDLSVIEPVSTSSKDDDLLDKNNVVAEMETPPGEREEVVTAEHVLEVNDFVATQPNAILYVESSLALWSEDMDKNLAAEEISVAGENRQIGPEKGFIQQDVGGLQNDMTDFVQEALLSKDARVPNDKQVKPAMETEEVVSEAMSGASASKEETRSSTTLPEHFGTFASRLPNKMTTAPDWSIQTEDSGLEQTSDDVGVQQIDTVVEARSHTEDNAPKRPEIDGLAVLSAQGDVSDAVQSNKGHEEVTAGHALEAVADTSLTNSQRGQSTEEKGPRTLSTDNAIQRSVKNEPIPAEELERVEEGGLGRDLAGERKVFNSRDESAVEGLPEASCVPAILELGRTQNSTNNSAGLGSVAARSVGLDQSEHSSESERGHKRNNTLYSLPMLITGEPSVIYDDDDDKSVKSVVSLRVFKRMDSSFVIEDDDDDGSILEFHAPFAAKPVLDDSSSSEDGDEDGDSDDTTGPPPYSPTSVRDRVGSEDEGKEASTRELSHRGVVDQDSLLQGENKESLLADIPTNVAVSNVIAQGEGKAETDPSKESASSRFSEHAKEPEEPAIGDDEYRKSIPCAPHSFSAVSISFLSFNIPAHTAFKVFEESLRIVRPGGHLYLVDYDGTTVKKLPADWRNMLTRVSQFDPHEMQANGMEEEEICNILRNMGKSKCYNANIARWVGTVPEDAF